MLEFECQWCHSHQRPGVQGGQSRPCFLGESHGALPLLCQSQPHQPVIAICELMNVKEVGYCFPLSARRRGNEKMSRRKRVVMSGLGYINYFLPTNDKFLASGLNSNIGFEVWCNRRTAMWRLGDPTTTRWEHCALQQPRLVGQSWDWFSISRFRKGLLSM